MSNDLINAIKLISAEKNIDENIILDTLKTSLIAACRKNFGLAQNIQVDINSETGQVQVIAYKKVVEIVEDERLEISLEEARNIDPNYNIEDNVQVVITPKDFGRIAAQTAKQVVSQKFLELERDDLYNKFADKKGKIIVGIVQNIELNNIIVSLGPIETVLTEKEQVPGEKFKINDRIKLYVLDVKRHSKGVMVLVSRANPNFIRCLFEQEIPEISDKIVKIVNISREPGKRSKVAIMSENKDIEAIGACIGENGNRINTILAELHNEKIDLVNWYENTEEYIKSALSPAKIKSININKEKNCALIVVENNQVSLAIGKSGQNIRLAAKLVGLRLDVKTVEQIEGEALSKNV